jgi:DNA-binding MarR family transcriptional regulator
MNEPKKPHLPIGYWLKRADEVLTGRINEAQRANGLSRTEWQILNVLYEVGSATDEQLATPMRPFADVTSLREAVTGLGQRGLIAGNGSADDRYVLTTQGQRTHEAALALQKEVRQQAIKGISGADYATAIRVLQQIVENLGGEGAAQQGAAADSPQAARR